MLAVLSPFHTRFNSKACYFSVNKLCFPKNPAGYLMDSLPGPFMPVAAFIFDH